MGADMKAIRKRIKSVDSTMHLARAMELVASSKLKRAGRAAERSRGYSDAFSDAMELVASDGNISSPYLETREIHDRCCIVIAGDRGLAGGYNNNIFRLASETAAGAIILPIGKRAVEYFRRHDYRLLDDSFVSSENITAEECFSVAKRLTEMYLGKEIDEISIIFTEYESMLSQTATVKRLLPIERKTDRKKSGAVTLFEPDAETVLDRAAAAYLSAKIYGAVCESFLSEVSARRTAMDSAQKNAEEMIEKLNIRYNRARQGAITREITEIVAGSEQ